MLECYIFTLFLNRFPECLHLAICGVGEDSWEFPWTAKRSNQSVLKEINPEYSSEGLMLKLKLQYIGHLIWRADSLEKTLMLGKTEGRRRRGWQRMRQMVKWCHRLNGHEFEQILRDSERQGRLTCCSPWGSQRVGHDWETGQQQQSE